MRLVLIESRTPGNVTFGSRCLRGKSLASSCRWIGEGCGGGLVVKDMQNSRRFVVASRADDLDVRVAANAGVRDDSGRRTGAKKGMRTCSRFVGASHVDGLISAAPMRAPQRGYTLIEVLVAFAVLALALTLLLGTLSGASRQVRWSADAGRAALHAESLLAQTGVGEVLQPGRRDGDFEDGRYRWQLEIAPYDDPTRPPQPVLDPFSPQLMRLRLQVAWGDGGLSEQLVVDSLRLVAPDPNGATLP